MNKISVLGGGSWGTTLANLLAAKDLNVSIWVRDPKIFVKKKNTLINKKLDQVFYYLVSLQTENAKEILDDL